MEKELLEKIESLEKQNKDLKELLHTIVVLSSNQEGAHFTEKSWIILVASKYLEELNR